MLFAAPRCIRLRRCATAVNPFTRLPSVFSVRDKASWLGADLLQIVERMRSSPDHWRAGIRRETLMNALFVIVAIIAIILLITGGFVQSVNFLLWVGLVLLILAIIAFLIRMIMGRNRV
jgi:hypothetical protein